MKSVAEAQAPVFRPPGAPAPDELRGAQREFLANAGHELRSPLAGIASAVDVLQHGAKEIPAERDRFLDHIERQTRCLDRLLGSLMTIATAQVEGAGPRLGVVMVRPLLEDVVSAARCERAAEYAVSCAPAVAVASDRALLEVALLNVVRNAARHTRDGRVRIIARSAPPGGALAIDVRDAGPGIAPEHRSRAFERFVGERAGHADGLGLGLAIARQAIELAGGTIELRAGLGGGTTVRVALAVACEAAA
jgi:signal transduction histidine kinase